MFSWTHFFLLRFVCSSKSIDKLVSFVSNLAFMRACIRATNSSATLEHRTKQVYHWTVYTLLSTKHVRHTQILL